MTIFYIENIRLPTEKAHGLQIMKTCESLASLGVQVRLIIPARYNPEHVGTDPFYFYGVEKKFTIERLWIPDPTFLLNFWTGTYIKLEALILILRLRLYFWFTDIPADTLVYTRQEYLLPTLQRVFGRVIWEAHNLPHNRKRYLPYWNKCYRVVAITAGLKNELVKLGLDSGKIAVVPDGVDLGKFKVDSEKSKVREELGLPADKKIVMYTGHLYEWKGAITLLQAARDFQFPEPRRTDFQTLFVFVGGTDNDIKKFREQADGLDNVLVLGHRPHMEIPKYLMAADVLVLPNSGKFEISRSYTSPLKLFEYMAAGRPIVASDLPSIREVLHEDTAMFFRPDDASDLAEKIREMISRPEFSEHLAINASKEAHRYSWQSRGEKILNFIRSAN